jgi:hypothetical protein
MSKKNPTKTELLLEIARLKDHVKHLSHDKAYNILTRPALELEFDQRAPEGDIYAVFIDLDKIHELNKIHGSYEKVDKMIRRAFKMRAGDLLLAGRWKSGDEIVFIVRSDPAGFIARLQRSLAKNGLSATCAFEKIIDNDLGKAVSAAMKTVFALKPKGDRS